MIRLFNTYKIPLLLLVIVIYGFWQLSFMEHIMKWDMIDDTFPKRFDLSECLRHGLLPLWSPYQSLGLPIHADPSSYAWYPVSWIISLLHGYDFYAINFEYLLHVFIAGLGMYSLGRRLKISNGVSFFMAICYIFCGFSVGNAQHAMLIIGAAWTPFVLSAFFEMLETKTRYAAIKTAFFIYMMFTGGYIVFTFIMAYVLLAILIYHFTNYILLKRNNEIMPLVANVALMGVCTLLLSLAYVICIYRILPYFTRANALSLDLIMQNPFTIKSFISFLFPYAVTTEVSYWNTDVSMSNGYFGLIAFIFLLFTAFIKPNSRQWLFLFSAVFFLTASTGNDMPVRKWLYDYVPLMNVFRLPGILRIYTILGFLLIQGFTLDEVLNNFALYKKKLIILSAAIGFVIAGFVIFNIPGSGDNLFSRAFENCMHATWPSNIATADAIWLQGCIQLAVIGAFVLIVYISPTAKNVLYGILCLTVLEMFVSTQLNMATTVIYKTELSESQYGFKNLPSGFPFTNTKRMIDISDKRPDVQIPGMWANLSFFTKETPFDGYTSFYLNRYDTLSHSPLFRSILNNKLVYLSDKVLRISNISQADINNPLNLFFNDADYNGIAKTPFSSSPADTVFITAFTPNKITARAITKGTQVVTLMQNNFPGWQVLVNDKPTELYTSNYTCISSVLPAGDNKIEFVFKPVSVIIGFWISLLAFLIVSAYLLWPVFIALKQNFTRNTAGETLIVE